MRCMRYNDSQYLSILFRQRSCGYNRMELSKVNLMDNEPTALELRVKIIGALLRDARLAAHKSLEDCAHTMGMSKDDYEAFELGTKPISLPELEAISYYLGIPIEQFWERKLLSEGEGNRSITNIGQLVALRHRMIGALLRQARLDAGLSLEILSQRTGLEITRLEAFELGVAAVPLPELEMLSGALHRSIREFHDQVGPVGLWNQQQRAIQDFLTMPLEMQVFISKPVNRPYLDLAIRLSDMSVDKLRAVAEGLLEITY